MKMDKDRIYMNIAHEIARLSHCVSHKVGAILVKDGRILSTGINGTPKKFMNCDQVFCGCGFSREDHHTFSENYEIHAETNAILFAAENGISIKGAPVIQHSAKRCRKTAHADARGSQQRGTGKVHKEMHRPEKKLRATVCTV